MSMLWLIFTSLLTAATVIDQAPATRQPLLRKGETVVVKVPQNLFKCDEGVPRVCSIQIEEASGALVVGGKADWETCCPPWLWEARIDAVEYALPNSKSPFYQHNKLKLTDAKGNSATLAFHKAISDFWKAFEQLVILGPATSKAPIDTGAHLRAGGFIYSKMTDPMTDADRSTIRTSSADLKHTLTWACMKDGLNIIFFYDEIVGVADSLTVTYRFATAPAVTQTWERLDARAVAAPISTVATFTAAATNADSLALRVEGGIRVATASFSLAGLHAALKQLPCAQ